MMTILSIVGNYSSEYKIYTYTALFDWDKNKYKTFEDYYYDVISKSSFYEHRKFRKFVKNKNINIKNVFSNVSDSKTFSNLQKSLYPQLSHILNLPLTSTN